MLSFQGGIVCSIKGRNKLKITQGSLFKGPVSGSFFQILINQKPQHTNKSEA